MTLANWTCYDWSSCFSPLVILYCWWSYSGSLGHMTLPCFDLFLLQYWKSLFLLLPASGIKSYKLKYSSWYFLFRIKSKGVGSYESFQMFLSLLSSTSDSSSIHSLSLQHRIKERCRELGRVQVLDLWGSIYTDLSPLSPFLVSSKSRASFFSYFWEGSTGLSAS